ncbi:ATP-binding protein [Micromonospora sp. NPDC002575]|uniref:ATP-binding protein n=1 Tax=Micromonospora sp. NPDC002575 TaxID=3364222 RepID=UPI0036B31DFB
MTRLPRPGTARTTADFVVRMRVLKLSSGLSYRALERRARASGDQLPASTIASTLNRVSLPSEEFVAALVRACGGDVTVTTEWIEARRALVLNDATTMAIAPEQAATGPAPAAGSVGQDPGEPGGARSDASSGRQLTPHLLPPDSPLFVGRDDEVSEAVRLLRHDTTGPATLLVTGPAGVGKTTFAVRVGHLLAPDFPDGQLYADLEGLSDEPTEPFTVLGAFLRALGVHGGSVPPDLTSRIHLYRTLLSKRKVLVVLDNAATTRQINSLLPSGDRCAAVVTSRTTLGELAGRRVQLGILDPVAGLALLRGMLGGARTDAEAEAAQFIVQTCAGLPLAVWVAGARLAARPHWPLAKVARALADEQRKLDELAVGDIAVRVSLEPTYRGLTTTARQALRMISLLPGPDLAGWALAALLDVSLSDAEALLDDLVEVHLVEIGRVSAAGLRYRLHDLVRLFGREQADREIPQQDRRAAFTRLLSTSLHLTDSAAEILSADFQGMPQTELVSWRLPQADTDQLLAEPLAWFDDERRFLLAVVHQALGEPVAASAAGLAIAMTTFFQVGSHFDDWERLQGRALQECLRRGDRRSAARLHRCLGELTTILDRYPEATNHFEQALLLADDQDSACRASATAGLAYVHRLLGRYATSSDHFARAADLARAAGNVNCLVYATNGIGVIDLEQGRLEQARQRFDECLRLSRSVGYQPGEAQALRCLGQRHRALGEYRSAADCFRLAASISHDLGDRLTATHATCWLGDVLVRQGEHAEGRRLLARSLWVYREFGNLWGEAAVLYALAEAQLAAGRPQLARRRAQAAVDLWRQVGSRSWLAIALDTLTTACYLTGDVQAAGRSQGEATGLRASAERAER